MDLRDSCALQPEAGAAERGWQGDAGNREQDGIQGDGDSSSGVLSERQAYQGECRQLTHAASRDRSRYQRRDRPQGYGDSETA